jgi:hypothetical protein
LMGEWETSGWYYVTEPKGRPMGLNSRKGSEHVVVVRLITLFDDAGGE